jgi:citronellol/citronellal dehydrogenase
MRDLMSVQNAANPSLSLQGKTLFITGASRGIGKAIGLRAAQDGANIVIAAKTTTPHPKLPGTIHTAAAEMEAAGGKALACAVDIRDEEQVRQAVAKAVETFGGIDILVNNASAINLTGTLATRIPRFDLMHQVNVRGTFVCSQACIPHLLKAANPHILNISPPLNFQAKYFAPHVAYTMAKFGMSLCVLGMAEEFRAEGIAVNALWPQTTIATAAVMNLLGGEDAIKRSRRPEIMADAAYWILTRPARETTGNFFIDEKVLQNAGVQDLSQYAMQPGAELRTDLFI